MFSHVFGTEPAFIEIVKRNNFWRLKRLDLRHSKRVSQIEEWPVGLECTRDTVVDLPLTTASVGL